MPTDKKEPKDKRVAFEIPSDIAPDYAALVAQLKTSKGGLGAIAARYVIPKLKSGELVCINSELVPANQAVKFLNKARRQAA